MTQFRVLCAGLVLAVATACGGPSPHEASLARETAHMQPMRADYDTTVTGFEIQSERIDVSIDLNQWETVDDATDQAIKDEALRLWKEAWTKENPGKHATLTVRLLDTQGREFFKETAKV